MLVLMRLMRWMVPALVFAAALAGGGIALAGLGQPSPWQLGLQQSAAPTMDDIVWFHNLLVYIITGITLFVLALLLIVIVKFNARANPVPSRTTHNTLLEVLWTVVPVVILVVIAIPSFRILFVQLNLPPADVTVKATGNQWNWTYTYPDAKIEFTSIMLQDDGRHSRLRGAILRHQDRRDPRAPQRNLVQGDPRGRLLRTVLGAVRQGSRFHADRGARRQRAGV
jgi:cytochrome c oxidase subunit II